MFFKFGFDLVIEFFVRMLKVLVFLRFGYCF